MLQDNEEWGLKHIYWNLWALKDILLQEAQSYTKSNVGHIYHLHICNTVYTRVIVDFLRP